MVGADARGDRELEVLGLGDLLSSQVGGPEGLRDHDVGVDQLALELRVLPVLVGRDDELMTRRLEELAQAEFARNAAEQLAGLEVDRARAGERLAVRIALDLGEAIARIAGRIAVD